MLFSIFITILVASFSVQIATADDGVVLQGIVLDSLSKRPIPGVAIRAKGASIGTYSKTNGRFRLPVSSSVRQLQVRGMGYQQYTIDVVDNAAELRIALLPTSVNLPTVNVEEEISAQEVIKRAIARKNQNNKRIQTLEQTLYSKVRATLDAGAISRKEGPADIITETFSTITEQRFPERRKHTRITQRRQTANVRSQENLAVFDAFFDFTEDENNILNTRLVTPLGKNALDEYNFTIDRKVVLDNLWVYEISFAPKSTLFPGYEGTLSIYEDSYQVVAAKFAPSQETAFPFLKNFTIEQRYDKVQDTLWVPTYQQASAELKVKVMPFVEIKANVSAQINVSAVRANIDVPDSLFPTVDPDSAENRVRTDANGATIEVRSRDGSRRTVVDPEADSVKPEYWDKYAFAEQSDEERKVYARQDSIQKNAPPSDESESRGPLSGSMIDLGSIGDVAFGLDPYINRTGITGTLYGPAFAVSAPGARLTASAGWGSQGTRVGRADLDVRLFGSRGYGLNALGSVFSSTASVQDARNSQLAFTSIDVANLIYAEFSDFYRRDGFDLGLRLRAPWGTTTVGGSWARHFNAPLVEDLKRDRALAVPGNYRVFGVRSQLFEGGGGALGSLFGAAKDNPVTGSIHGIYGTELTSNASFWSVDASITGHIPTVRTGYSPMMLDLTLEGGIQPAETPQQYRFVTLRTFPVLGMTNMFATININRFAGTEYATLHAEHNFTDLWWRAIGLPALTFGRGVDLIGRFSATNVVQRAKPLAAGQFFDSSNGYYMEAGLAVSRIPSYFSDFIFLRVDARWPVGPRASQGSFGWILTLSSPLM
jgi:hypothetical protein